MVNNKKKPKDKNTFLNFLSNVNIDDVAKHSKEWYSVANPKRNQKTFQPYIDLNNVIKLSTTSLQTSILAYLEKEAQNLKWTPALLKKLQKYVEAYANSNKDNSLITYTTAIRNVLYKKGINKAVIVKNFQVFEKTQARNVKSGEILDEKRQNQKEILDTDIYELLNSWRTDLSQGKLDYKDATLALELTTGVRSNESLNNEMTKFSKSNMGDNYIHLDGVSKKTKEYRAGQPKSIVSDNPILLFNASEILKMKKIIDKEVSRYLSSTKTKKTDSQLTKQYNGKLNAHLGTLMKNHPDITTHNLREIYANLTYKMYAPKNHDRTKWITDILRHTSKQAALNYQKLYIHTELPKDSPEALKLLKQVEIKAENTIQRVNDLENEVKDIEKPDKILGHKRDGLEAKFKRLDIHSKDLLKQKKKLTYKNLSSIGIGRSTIAKWKLRSKD